MANPKTDRELLRDYAEQGCEAAFQALVERHVDLVFGTAFRGLNEPGAAQEITQNVFIALARKAAWLRGETSLAGWLHKSALLETRHWWRGELRRQCREQTAAELGTTMKDDESLLKSLAEVLDEGLLTLGETDRQALMLRYFEGRTHREIGSLLGAKEDAVRMRINKALGRLTDFFRHRGFSVPAAATTAAALTAAAKAAPVGFGAITAQVALSVAGAGAATGIRLLFAKLMGLTHTQAAAMCLLFAAAPIGWEMKANHAFRSQAATTRSILEVARTQQAELANELERLRAESAQLDATLADTVQTQARYAQAALKLEALKGRVRALLTDDNYRWPDDLPYVRVSKSVVKRLELMKHTSAFGGGGALTEPALELFGIAAQEKLPTEQALANYRHGVDALMSATAYETNLPGLPTVGRLTHTVVVPALGQPLKTLANTTRAQLTDVLGADRETLLFGGWDQGGIQIFWPGTIWMISDKPQVFSVWVETTANSNAPRYGGSWSVASVGGTSSEGRGSLGVFPNAIAMQFFVPWLNQLGITDALQFP